MLPVNRTREEARRFYDRISHCYSFVARAFEWKYTRTGLEQLSLREGERVLEIGFGSGEALVEIARLVGSKGKAHGLDISSGMLEVTKGRLEKARLADRVRTPMHRCDTSVVPRC